VSYTHEFLSENGELQAAASVTRQLYPEHDWCFVADSGLDDPKLLAPFQSLDSTFIIRVQHAERLVDVWNERRHGFERERLGDLTLTLPPMLKLEATFTQARQT